jgi:TrpR-related protein YerC/YecD
MSSNHGKKGSTTSLRSDVVGPNRLNENDVYQDPLVLKRNHDALLIDFFAAMSSIENAGEAKLFLSDLLSNVEIRMLARRLRIAIYLVSGFSYSQIRKDLGASPGTIRKVSQWLERQGLGYTLVIQRMAEIGGLAKPEKLLNTETPNNPHGKPSRNALYFWPTALVNSIINSSKRRSST